MRVTLSQSSPNFCFELFDENGKSIHFVQSDWDYAGLACMLGWSVSQVYPFKRKDFDYSAECIFCCHNCNEVLYPMEVYHEADHVGRCPECLEPVEPYTPCRHDNTDGTVDCKSCGLKVTDFLSAAYDWLSDHDGESFELDSEYADALNS